MFVNQLCPKIKNFFNFFKNIAEQKKKGIMFPRYVAINQNMIGNVADLHIDKWIIKSIFMLSTCIYYLTWPLSCLSM